MKEIYLRRHEAWFYHKEQHEVPKHLAEEAELQGDTSKPHVELPKEQSAKWRRELFESSMKRVLNRERRRKGWSHVWVVNKKQRDFSCEETCLFLIFSFQHTSKTWGHLQWREIINANYAILILYFSISVIWNLCMMFSRRRLNWIRN